MVDDAVDGVGTRAVAGFGNVAADTFDLALAPGPTSQRTDETHALTNG